MVEHTGVCRANPTLDSSMMSNVRLPLHNFRSFSNEDHDSTPCPTHVALVRGITASTQAIAVLGPLLSARHLYSRCALVCLYILSTAPIPQAVTREAPQFVCLDFI